MSEKWWHRGGSRWGGMPGCCAPRHPPVSRAKRATRVHAEGVDTWSGGTGVQVYGCRGGVHVGGGGGWPRVVGGGVAGWRGGRRVRVYRCVRVVYAAAVGRGEVGSGGGWVVMLFGWIVCVLWDKFEMCVLGVI